MGANYVTDMDTGEAVVCFYCQKPLGIREYEGGPVATFALVIHEPPHHHDCKRIAEMDGAANARHAFLCHLKGCEWIKDSFKRE